MIKDAFYPAPNPAHAVAFSPDGKVLTAATDAGTRLWDLQTGKLLHGTSWKSTAIFSTFSTDGKTVRTLQLGRPDLRGESAGYIPYSVLVWDAPTGTLLRSVRIPVRGDEWWTDKHAVISPDGLSVAISSVILKRTKRGRRQFQVYLFNSRSGRLKAIIGRNFAEVNVAAFSPDSRVVATSQWGGNVQFWDAQSGKLLRSLNPSQRVATGPGMWSNNGAVTFAPDGTTLASGSGHNIWLWHLPSGRLLRTLHATRELAALAFSPDGATLAAGHDDHTVRLWRIK